MPIVSIFALVNLFFWGLATWKFYSVYKETKDKKVGYLYKGFFSFSISLVFLFYAGGITRNLKIIDLIYDVYTFFTIAGQAFLVNITFEILRWEKIKRIVFFTLVLAGAVVAIVPTLNMNSAQVSQEGPFVFWEDTRGAFMNTLMGMTMMFSGLWFFLFFLIKGLAAKDNIVKAKGILMSGGMFFMILLGLVDYIIGPFFGILHISLFTVLCGLSAALCFFSAVHYKKTIQPI